MPHRSRLPAHARHALPCLMAVHGLFLPVGGAAQAPDRLWGEVTTASGERHEGYLRWDRNEAGWADLLDGTRSADVALLDRMAAARGDAPRDRSRSVEFLGVRISWDDDTDGGRVGAAIRFGHLRSLRTLGDDGALLVLRDGSEVEFHSASSDLGTGIRGVRICPPGGADVDLEWRDVDRIDFGPVPAGAADPDAFRLHGTVEDRWGGRWTGDLSWDRDEALSSDILDGDEDGEEREIRFERIAAVARRPEGGSRVTLRNGRDVVLVGSNDVDEGHRGVQVSDPELGRIDVPWSAFSSVRFHPPVRPLGYDDVGGVGPLTGTVTTRGGDSLTGAIAWDGDESAGWQILDGEYRGIDFDVEFGRIARIEKLTTGSARVTLRDGRTLELSGANDVDRDNRGIVVQGDDGSFAVVRWRDFVRLDLEAGR